MGLGFEASVRSDDMEEFRLQGLQVRDELRVEALVEEWFRL